MRTKDEAHSVKEMKRKKRKKKWKIWTVQIKSGKIIFLPILCVKTQQQCKQQHLHAESWEKLQRHVNCLFIIPLAAARGRFSSSPELRTKCIPGGPHFNWCSVAPENLPSWFMLMFHHKHHIALHSYIVMGSKYFGYQVFLNLWKLIVLKSCLKRASLS